MDIINSKNLLRQVTIMISTIPERKIYLKRILNFYNKFDCKIIVIGSTIFEATYSGIAEA